MADSSVITEEFTVRIAKNTNKRYNIMQFRATPKVDISTWTQVRMKREDNKHELKPDEIKPKYGAGSEYGQERREEARRKKYGGKVDKVDKPWCLEIGGKKGKKYRGLKQAGIFDNSSYFVFIKSQDGSIDAYPIEDWTSFTQMPTHRTLNAEEAEEQFGKKDTEPILNYFAAMKGNLKTDMEEKNKRLKIAHYSENQDSDSSDIDENEEKIVKKPKPKRKEKKVKTESDDESVESDDGDREGKEIDVMSSSDEEETEELNVLNMSESEEETEKVVEDVKKIAGKAKIEKKSSSSESSGDDSDEYDKNGDPIIRSAVFLQSSKEKKLDIKEMKQGKALKRKIKTSKQKPPAKKVKIEKQEVSSELTANDDKKSSKKVMSIVPIPAPNADLSGESDVNIIKLYLTRKPITAKELIKKFKSKNKNTDLTSTEIVQKVAQIMKQLDLQQTIVDGQTFFSMKK